MTLVPLPAFADNCIWMSQDGHDAIVVDPGDAGPVSEALPRGNLQLAAILVTRCEALRARGRPTLPSQRATGRRIHPSLRSCEATVSQSVQAHAGLCAQAAPAEVFPALRQWKNDFR